MGDLRALWASHAAQLDQRLRLDRRALRTTLAQETETTLSRYAWVAWIQLAVAAVMLLANGSFLVVHRGDPGYLTSAVAVQLYLILHLSSAAYRLTLVHRIDYAGSVTVMQRTLERVKITEYHTLKWALALGVLLWVPVLAVLVQGLGGVDLYAHVPAAWVVANLVFGIVVVVFGLALARHLVERPGLGPAARALVEAVAGTRLRRATRFLAELAEFEREPR